MVVQRVTRYQARRREQLPGRQVNLDQCVNVFPHSGRNHV
jgi:hypothetical protein